MRDRRVEARRFSVAVGLRKREQGGGIGDEQRGLRRQQIRDGAELKELLAMDMDVLPEDVRPVYIARRKGLIEFFINNPV